jgi:quercetin dioxygenase-like cupin family protein
MMNELLRNEQDVAAVSEPWPWSSSLDALVSAPQYHRLMYENERVRVLEVRIPRGHIVPVHTHRWPAVLHLQSWSEHLRRDESGRLVFDSREAGRAREIPSVVWCPPLPPHSVENIGEAELLVLSVELKDAVGTRQLIR